MKKRNEKGGDRKKRRLRTGLLLAVPAAIIVAAYATVHLLNAREAQQEVPEPPEEGPKPYYDADHFSMGEDGWLRYEDETYTSQSGIDVSDFQKDIDWSRVRAAGVSFAMIRAGYRGYETGRLNEDAYFRQNLDGALAAGVEPGVYFFSQAVTAEEAREEATFVLDRLRGYDSAIPVVFDMEHIEGAQRIESLSREEKTAIAETFCETVQAAGRQPIIYGNPDWLEQDMDMNSLQAFPLWLAHYTDQASYPGPHIMWQYSDSGQVDGISTMVDLDILFERKGDA